VQPLLGRNRLGAFREFRDERELEQLRREHVESSISIARHPQRSVVDGRRERGGKYSEQEKEGAEVSHSRHHHTEERRDATIGRLPIWRPGAATSVALSGTKVPTPADGPRSHDRGYIQNP
jgi:hypothetical protein